MDKLEETLKTILQKEEQKYITCNITNKTCTRCQPLCVNRQEQERKILKGD